MTTSPEPTLIELVRYDNWMNQQLPELDMRGYQEAYPDRFGVRLVKMSDQP